MLNHTKIPTVIRWQVSCRDGNATFSKRVMLSGMLHVGDTIQIQFCDNEYWYLTIPTVYVDIDRDVVECDIDANENPIAFDGIDEAIEYLGLSGWIVGRVFRRTDAQQA